MKTSIVLGILTIIMIVDYTKRMLKDRIKGKMTKWRWILFSVKMGISLIVLYIAIAGFIHYI